MSDIASNSSAQPDGAPPTVTDRRPVPRGVLPRHVQTWVMAGVAVGSWAGRIRPRAPRRPLRRRRRPRRIGCATTRIACVCSRRRPSERPARLPWRRPSRPITATRLRRRRRIRSPMSGAGASTRASSPATSCSVAGPTRNGPIRGERRRHLVTPPPTSLPARPLLSRWPRPSFVPPRERQASLAQEAVRRRSGPRLQGRPPRSHQRGTRAGIRRPSVPPGRSSAYWKAPSSIPS